MPPEPAAHHRIAVHGHAGTLHLNASFELSAPWTVIFGPSGSGKSTLLRALCGLPPSLNTTLQRAGHDLSHTPTHRRLLTYAPQGGIVFPHLSVEQNVAFAGGGRHVSTALELFELQPLAARMPGGLSGGERQRVSLARAFAVARTRLLVLDEPFTGIDRNLRARLLPRMQAAALARDLPVLSVTHDVEEALLLDAEVIRLDTHLGASRILAQGPAREVLAEEVRAIQRVLAPSDSL